MKKLLSIVFIAVLTLTACSPKVRLDENGQPEMVGTSEKFKTDVNACYVPFPIAYRDGDGDKYGDIQGLTDALDYIDETGFDCIWLNPVHPSPTYHRYDVVDYYEIDEQLGTLEDYQTFLDEAHERGIVVLMDFVINHTSSEHPWFLEARDDVDSKYRDWYIFNTLEDKTSFPNKEGWHKYKDEYYYGSFWGGMPDLNISNPEVRDEIKKITKYWLDMGVDGFRIDAALHLYDVNEYPRGTSTLQNNVDFFRELNQFIKDENADAFLLAEVWTNSRVVSRYYEGMDSAFNFDFGVNLIDAINSGSNQGFVDELVKNRDQFFTNRADAIDSIFLTNHDQDRLLTQLGGSTGKAKLAAHVLFTSPGLPFVLYGEEIGMVGSGDHENIREPFKWTSNLLDEPNSEWRNWNENKETVSLEDQMKDVDSMYATYKKLLDLRNNDDVLKYGDYNVYEGTLLKSLLTYTRSYEETTYVVVNNITPKQKDLKTDGTNLEVVYSSHTFNVNDFVVEPYSTVILKVDNVDFKIEIDR